MDNKTFEKEDSTTLKVIEPMPQSTSYKLDYIQERIADHAQQVEYWTALETEALKLGIETTAQVEQAASSLQAKVG